MAVQIILKNSSTEDKRPQPSYLSDGEIALNWNAAGAFLTCRDTNGDIQQVGGVKVSATAPIDPVKQTMWYDQTEKYLYIYDGAAWQEIGASLELENHTDTTLDVVTSPGEGVTLPAATDTLAGLMTAADKNTLDSGGTPSGGTGDRPSTPNVGDLFFDTDLELLLVWNGSEWEETGVTTYTYPGGVEQTIQARLEQYVSVKDFGAVGDGITDDTAAIRLAIAAAQQNIFNRYEGGQTVYFPAGSYYITDTIEIKEPDSIPSGGGFSNITLKGAGSNSSTIRAVDPSFDYISFVGKATRAFFGGNVIGLGFAAAGDATAGAMLKMYRVIGSNITDIKFDGAYQGLILDGCADTAITGLYAKDDSRTGGSGLTVIELNATEFACSDIIISDYQIKSTSSTYSFVIRGADGVYVSNGHQFGGLRFEPTGIGASQSTASSFWTNVYFDTSPASNVYFAGNTDTPSKYTNHRFTSCDFRDGDRGLLIDTTTTVSNLIVNGCRFATHKKEGMSLTSQTASNIIVADNLFIDSNTLDSASYADLVVDCDDVIISNCIFEGGGPNGKSLKILGNAANYNVSTCSWVNSTMDTKISDLGTGGSLSNCLGVVIENKGFASIPGGDIAFTVDHGLDFTPSQANISLTQLTRGTNATGVVSSYYVDNVTATSFDINLSDASTSGINFAWRAFYK